MGKHAEVWVPSDMHRLSRDRHQDRGSESYAYRALSRSTSQPESASVLSASVLDEPNERRLRLSANMANMSGGTLGEVLRQARVKLDLGLREFAKKLGITPSYLSDIEYDRRVPSEEVLSKLAGALHLEVDHLMALAGRVGDDAERYLKHHPAAGVLFRRISDRKLPEEDLKKLLQEVDKMGSKKGRS